MFSTRRTFLASALALGVAARLQPAFADNRGTTDEAKAMALKAAKFAKDVGRDKALAAFTNDPAWHDRDLFVYAYDFKGICIANGGVKALVGKDLSETTDPISGGKIVQEQIKVATGPGEGWTEYHFSNPATKKIEKKKTYVVRVGDYYLGVGAYIGE